MISGGSEMAAVVYDVVVIKLTSMERDECLKISEFVNLSPLIWLQQCTARCLENDVSLSSF